MPRFFPPSGQRLEFWLAQGIAFIPVEDYFQYGTKYVIIPSVFGSGPPVRWEQSFHPVRCVMIYGQTKTNVVMSILPKLSVIAWPAKLKPQQARHHGPAEGDFMPGTGIRCYDRHTPSDKLGYTLSHGGYRQLAKKDDMKPAPISLLGSYEIFQ